MAKLVAILIFTVVSAGFSCLAFLVAMGLSATQAKYGNAFMATLAIGVIAGMLPLGFLYDRKKDQHDKILVDLTRAFEANYKASNGDDIVG